MSEIEFNCPWYGATMNAGGREMARKISVMMIAALMSFVAPLVVARTYEFKALGTKGSSSGNQNWWGDAEKKKSAFFQIKVGQAGKVDDKSKMEIRAATIFKNAKDRTTGVNDVATFSFDPINDLKPLYFTVVTGSAKNQGSYGWQVAGVIIEMWQNGKMIRHWTNVPGKGGVTRLTEDVKPLFIWNDGQAWHGSSDFNNATEIVPVNQKGEKVDIDEILKECTAVEGDEKKGSEANADKSNNETKEIGATAEKESGDGMEGEFLLKSFCGFEFGKPGPTRSRSNYVSSRSNYGYRTAISRTVTLKRAFRQYTRARLQYGAYSENLIAITIISNDRYNNEMERTTAAAAAAAVIEKKYGITMEDYGSSFSYVDDNVNISINANEISVRRLDLEQKEDDLRSERRDATKRQIKAGGGSADDGADVL